MGQIRVNDDGTISGAFESGNLGIVDISGSIDRQGSLQASLIYKGTEIGVAWGYISAGGIGDGYWENKWGDEGTWRAVRIQV